jgi:hypothetical protein
MLLLRISWLVAVAVHPACDAMVHAHRVACMEWTRKPAAVPSCLSALATCSHMITIAVARQIHTLLLCC